MADAAAGDDLAGGAIDGNDGAGRRGSDVGARAVGRKVESEGRGADGDRRDLFVGVSVDDPGGARSGADSPDFRASGVGAEAGGLSADGNDGDGGEFDEVDDGDGAVGGVGYVGFEAEAGAKVGGEAFDGGEPDADGGKKEEEEEEAVVDVGGEAHGWWDFRASG